MSDDDAEASPSLDMTAEQAAGEAMAGEGAPEGGAEGAPAPPEVGGMEPPDGAADSTPFWARTEPNPDVQDMDGFDDWREYRSQYLQRGVMKMAGADDAMAVIDLLKGGVGFGAELVEKYDI